MPLQTMVSTRWLQISGTLSDFCEAEVQDKGEHSKKSVKSNEPMNVLEANGSVRSIVVWAKKAGLDRGQTTALRSRLPRSFSLFLALRSTSTDWIQGSTITKTFICKWEEMAWMSSWCTKEGIRSNDLFASWSRWEWKITVIDLLMGICLQLLQLPGQF